MCQHTVEQYLLPLLSWKNRGLPLDLVSYIYSFLHHHQSYLVNWLIHHHLVRMPIVVRTMFFNGAFRIYRIDGVIWELMSARGDKRVHRLMVPDYRRLTNNLAEYHNVFFTTSPYLHIRDTLDVL